MTATPVVLVHGDWDTSTLIENTLGLLPYSLTATPSSCTEPATTGLYYQLLENPAAKQAIYDFLRTGETKGLDKT